MLPSASRLAAFGLAIAAVVIVALAALALAELEREAELHREVIGGMHAKDSLESLRVQLSELGLAVRVVALTGDLTAVQRIEARSVEAEAELAYLAQHPSNENDAAFGDLRQAVTGFALQARSIAGLRAARGTPEAMAAAGAAENAQRDTLMALGRVLDMRVKRINDRALDQIRLTDTLRSYVSWLLAGSVVVLFGLFATYRWAALRERAARERIEHLAHYDTVTGLPNRALLTDRLEQEVARARRGSGAFALLMLDLDGFKSVNDKWGHAAGDRVLTLVGQRARQALRASDTIGRLGGDEFMAILPDASATGAKAVAAKIVQAVAQPYALPRGEARLSASVGLAMFPADGADSQLLQRAADDALYAAKREGKNRVLSAAGALTEETRTPAGTDA